MNIVRGQWSLIIAITERSGTEKSDTCVFLQHFCCLQMYISFQQRDCCLVFNGTFVLSISRKWKMIVILQWGVHPSYNQRQQRDLQRECISAISVRWLPCIMYLPATQALLFESCQLSSTKVCFSAFPVNERKIITEKDLFIWVSSCWLTAEMKKTVNRLVLCCTWPLRLILSWFSGTGKFSETGEKKVRMYESQTNVVPSKLMYQ